MLPRPKNFVIEYPSGKTVELDEETTERLYKLADRHGISPQDALRTMMKDAYEEIMKVN